jgi:hypothetical protein
MPEASDEVRNFLEGMREQFDRACVGVGSVPARALSIAGRQVSVRVAGAVLSRTLTSALTHAASDPSATDDLTIDCWDRAATGVPPPHPPRPISDFLPSGAVRGLPGERLRVTYDRWMRMLTVYDRERSHAFVHVAHASELPEWVARAPFRQLLGWWAADRGLAMLHAGTAATERGAVAFAGTSGSGKSTSALTCVAAGMGFMGDDACLVDLDPTPVAHTLYGHAKLEPDAFRRLVDLHHLVVGADDDRQVLDPARHVVSQAPLRAVLLVSVGSERLTSLTPATPKDAFRVLVSSSVDEGGGSVMAGLRRVATEVPCYHAVLGSDPEALVQTVGELLR